MASNGNDAGLTVDDLLDRVRGEVARRRHPLSAPPPHSRGISLSPDFQHLEVLLSHADRIADVGTRVPPFGVFGPVRRRLARGLTRGLYFFLQVISVDQRVFNNLILQVLRGLNGGVRKAETALGERFEKLAGTLADVQVRIARSNADIQARIARSNADVATHMSRMDGELTGLGRTLDAQIARLQEDLAIARERLTILETGRPASELARLYVDFEDRFRGDRNSILARVREHLPIVAAAGAGTAERPVLDIGCGRGEWLEALREAGLHANGVDVNPLMVAECQRLGLTATTDDAIGHLRRLPAGSCGAVTALHVVEHIPFASLVDLLDETVRVLAPGGVAIFETPNAFNLLVGACTFHTDPTHRQPLAPDVLHFLAENRGLARVAIQPLHRSPLLPPLPEDAPAALRRLMPCLEAAEDFAVIGYRT